MAFTDFKKRIRSVNAMILNTEKRYGKDSNVMKRIRKTVEKVMGEGATRFSSKALDGASLRKISQFDTALSYIEHSSYTTKAGRKAMEEKARRTFAENNPNLSASAYDEYVEYKRLTDDYLKSLKTNDLLKYSELKSVIYDTIYRDSFQIIDEIGNTAVSGYDMHQIALSYIDYQKDESVPNDEKLTFFEYVKEEMQKKEQEELQSNRDTVEKRTRFRGRNNGKTRNKKK